MERRIEFSHHYSKLHGQTSGLLVSVRPFKREWICDEAIAYDTDGVFPLEDCDYLQLLFIGNKQIPFTTYRKDKPEKRKKYMESVGAVFLFHFIGGCDGKQ